MCIDLQIMHIACIYLPIHKVQNVHLWSKGILLSIKIRDVARRHRGHERLQTVTYLEQAAMLHGRCGRVGNSSTSKSTV